MHDPIRDMLIRIKNAGDAGKEAASMPYSKMKLAIANLLMKEGYITSVAKKGKKEGKVLEVGIAYNGKKPKVSGVSFISKLSRRVYFGVGDITPVRQGYGDLVLTTPKGILTGKEARRERVGGEALFKIW
jgi:small subunit ribosomal protein S8